MCSLILPVHLHRERQSRSIGCCSSSSVPRYRFPRNNLGIVSQPASQSVQDDGILQFSILEEIFGDRKRGRYVSTGSEFNLISCSAFFYRPSAEELSLGIVFQFAMEFLFLFPISPTCSWLAAVQLYPPGLPLPQKFNRSFLHSKCPLPAERTALSCSEFRWDSTRS